MRGAGGSVIASQSRQENFSRTCSMIFQRRGSHSRVFETTSPSLCSRTLPHLPQAQGAGSTIRSTGRLSGRGVGAAAEFARAFAWRLPEPRSRPWFPARPGSLRGPRWRAQAARSAACRVRRIARTARAAPWPASASAARFPAGRRSLRSSPASASRAAQGSSRAQRQGRREAADRRASSRRQSNHIRR